MTRLLYLTLITATILFTGCANWNDVLGPGLPSEAGELDFDLEVTVEYHGNPVQGAVVYASAMGWETSAVTNSNGLVLLAVPERAEHVEVWATYAGLTTNHHNWYLRRGLNRYTLNL